jgi:hypothetical protein
MTRYDALVRLIGDAIDEMNQARSAPPLGASPETILLGPGGSLDSMGFVVLAAIIEERCEQALDRPVSVIEVITVGADEPFTVGALAQALAAAVADGARP